MLTEKKEPKKQELIPKKIAAGRSGSIIHPPPRCPLLSPIHNKYQSREYIFKISSHLLALRGWQIGRYLERQWPHLITKQINPFLQEKEEKEKSNPWVLNSRLREVWKNGGCHGFFAVNEGPIALRWEGQTCQEHKNIKVGTFQQFGGIPSGRALFVLQEKMKNEKNEKESWRKGQIWLSQWVAGLLALHALNITHNDINPNNALVQVEKDTCRWIDLDTANIHGKAQEGEIEKVTATHPMVFRPFFHESFFHLVFKSEWVPLSFARRVERDWRMAYFSIFRPLILALQSFDPKQKQKLKKVADLLAAASDSCAFCAWILLLKEQE